MPFQCTVVTPEQQAFDASVTQAIIPAHDGLIGILHDRAPLLVKLGIGPLRLDLQGGQKQFFLLEGGVAQMKNNKLTILTQVATPSTEINAETAKAEFAEATARRGTDEKSIESRDRDLQRARAKQELAGKR